MLLRCLPSLLLVIALAGPLSTPAQAQAPGARQQQEVAQGEHCFHQMERDPQGAIDHARKLLAQDDASGVVRTMSLVCLMRSQLSTGRGQDALDALPELLELLDSAQMPQQLRVEMRMLTATALQELGLVRQAGEVLADALVESEPYTNLHLQALVGVALHHARSMGDPAAAEPYFERAIAVTLKRLGGQLPVDAIPYFNYGLAKLEQGGADEAEVLLEHARTLSRRDRHFDRLTGRIDGSLARIALDRGDLAAARAQFEDVLARQRTMGDAPGVASSLRQMAELAHSNATDALTGLANRRHTTRVLEALQVAGGDGDLRAALLLLDVDHFKAINDSHGHGAGDQVLEALGHCLREACDANDVVARWGGEEFLVLRPQTSPAAAHALAEHLRAAVEALVIPLPGGQSASVTVSIGVAPCPYFPGHGDGWQDAIRMADRALYAAKHSGRNAWAGTWGEAAGRHVDVYSVRQDPETALARGWITVAGSRPISWSQPRDGHASRQAADADRGIRPGQAG